MMIPRAVDAAKVRSDELQKNTALQQQQAVNAQNRAEDTLKQVYSRSKTEEARITDKQRGNDQPKEGKKKKDGEKEKEGKKENTGKKYGSAVRTSRIDIKI